jgi:hypothetical protein
MFSNVLNGAREREREKENYIVGGFISCYFPSRNGRMLPVDCYIISMS